MKSLSRKVKVLLVSVLALGAVMVSMPNEASAADCRPVPPSGVHYSQAVTVSNGTAVGRFVVPAGCPAQHVSMASYLRHENPYPYSQQKLYSANAGRAYAPGSYTITVPVPANGCYFQVDMFRGAYESQLRDVDYVGTLQKVFGWALGGSRDCITPPKPVTPTTTTTNICSNVNSPNSAACNETITTVVNENKPAPAAPAAEKQTPGKLPETGVGGTLAAFFGATSFGSMIYYAFARRFGSL